MTAFETPAHLASWAGVCPGQHESAGISKHSHTRAGNVRLKGALGIAAMAAVHTNGSFFQHRYKRRRPLDFRANTPARQVSSANGRANYFPYPVQVVNPVLAQLLDTNLQGEAPTGNRPFAGHRM